MFHITSVIIENCVCYLERNKEIRFAWDDEKEDWYILSLIYKVFVESFNSFCCLRELKFKLIRC